MWRESSEQRELYKYKLFVQPTTQHIVYIVIEKGRENVTIFFFLVCDRYGGLYKINETVLNDDKRIWLSCNISFLTMSFNKNKFNFISFLIRLLIETTRFETGYVEEKKLKVVL